MSNGMPPQSGFRYFRVAERAAVADRYAETAEVELRDLLEAGEAPQDVAVVSPWAAHLGGVLGNDGTITGGFFFASADDLAGYLTKVGTTASVVAQVDVEGEVEGEVGADWDDRYAAVGSWEASVLRVRRLWLGASFASVAGVLGARHDVPIELVAEPIERAAVVTLAGPLRGRFVGIDVASLAVMQAAAQ